MNGQIRVKSELGKGTIFGVELPFERSIQPTLSDTHRFEDTPRLSRRTTPPASAPGQSPRRRDPSMPPFMHATELNAKQILETVETTTHIEGVFSPLTDVEPFGRGAEKGDYERALSLANSDSPGLEESVSQYPDMDSEGQTSLVHMNVLVAEDNPINLHLMNKKLSRRGHKVDLACDGQECHDQYVGNVANTDVILMDIAVRTALLVDFEV